MSLVRWFHCESSLSVRPAPPGPEAHDGRPAKATPGLGVAAGMPASRGGPGGAASTGPRGYAKRHRGASQRRPHLTVRRTRTIPDDVRVHDPAAYCGVPRFRGPSPRSASGTARPAARPTRAGPDKTSAGAASRNPVGATRGEGSPAAPAPAGGAAGWFAAAPRVVLRRGAAASYAATFSGQCDSSSTRSQSSSDDACPRHRTR